jgi:hypothetical protein
MGLREELAQKFTKNTSLQRDIQNHPALAKRLKEKYPDRFDALAGPNYKEVPIPAPPTKPIRRTRKQKALAAKGGAK